MKAQSDATRDVEPASDENVVAIDEDIRSVREWVSNNEDIAAGAVSLLIARFDKEVAARKAAELELGGADERSDYAVEQMKVAEKRAETAEGLLRKHQFRYSGEGRCAATLCVECGSIEGESDPRYTCAGRGCRIAAIPKEGE